MHGKLCTPGLQKCKNEVYAEEIKYEDGLSAEKW